MRTARWILAHDPVLVIEGALPLVDLDLEAGVLQRLLRLSGAGTLAEYGVDGSLAGDALCDLDLEIVPYLFSGAIQAHADQVWDAYLRRCLPVLKKDVPAPGECGEDQEREEGEQRWRSPPTPNLVAANPLWGRWGVEAHGRRNGVGHHLRRRA